MKQNQKGFSVVEILIVIVVIGLIGTVGWLVYDRQKSPKQSETTQQSTNTQSDTKTTDSSKGTEQTQQKYLEIKEWSVKLPVSSDVGSLSYTVKTNTASIRSTELDKLSGTGCTSNSINVVRGKATEIVLNEIGEGGSTFLEAYNSTTVDNANLNTRSIKAKVGDYYYVVPGYAGASCIDIPYEKPEGKVKQEAETKAMLDIVKSLNQMVLL
jgi:prepilin-type N-terminal cleavage/methylation domain-containing protein